MAVLEILTAPNPKLKVQAKPVSDVSKVQGLIDDMLDTMYSTDDGIGLAATQVGSDQAILVIDLSDERNEPLVMINPEITQGNNKEKGEEGCLSVPGYRADVERFTHIVVNFLDRDGNQQTIDTEEFLAIVIQHEMDHLKGKLFIDYLSPMKRNMALKKVKKAVAA